MANDKEIRAIIAGSRNFVDYNLLEKECDTILSCKLLEFLTCISQIVLNCHSLIFLINFLHNLFPPIFYNFKKNMALADNFHFLLQKKENFHI